MNYDDNLLQLDSVSGANNQLPSTRMQDKANNRKIYPYRFYNKNNQNVFGKPDTTLLISIGNTKKLLGDELYNNLSVDPEGNPYFIMNVAFKRQTTITQNKNIKNYALNINNYEVFSGTTNQFFTTKNLERDEASGFYGVDNSYPFVFTIDKPFNLNSFNRQEQSVYFCTGLQSNLNEEDSEFVNMHKEEILENEFDISMAFINSYSFAIKLPNFKLQFIDVDIQSMESSNFPSLSELPLPMPTIENPNVIKYSNIDFPLAQIVKDFMISIFQFNSNMPNAMTSTSNFDTNYQIGYFFECTTTTNGFKSWLGDMLKKHWNNIPSLPTIVKKDVSKIVYFLESIVNVDSTFVGLNGKEGFFIPLTTTYDVYPTIWQNSPQRFLLDIFQHISKEEFLDPRLIKDIKINKIFDKLDLYALPAYTKKVTINIKKDGKEVSKTYDVLDYDTNSKQQKIDVAYDSSLTTPKISPTNLYVNNYALLNRVIAQGESEDINDNKIIVPMEVYSDLVPIKAFPVHTNDELSFKLEWMDYSFMSPLLFLDKISNSGYAKTTTNPQQSFVSLFLKYSDISKTWIWQSPDAKTACEAVADMIMMTKLVNNGFADIPPQITYKTAIGYGKADPTATVGYGRYRIGNLDTGVGSKSNLVDRVYNNFITATNLSPKDSLWKIFHCAINMLGKYINSEHVVAQGETRFNTIYSPWYLELTNPVTLYQENDGTSTAPKLKNHFYFRIYDDGKDPTIVPKGDVSTPLEYIKSGGIVKIKSTWFNVFENIKKLNQKEYCENQEVAPKRSHKDISELIMKQAETMMNLPYLPDSLVPIPRSSLPGDVSTRTNHDLSYFFWCDLPTQHAFEEMFMISEPIKDSLVTLTREKTIVHLPQFPFTKKGDITGEFKMSGVIPKDNDELDAYILKYVQEQYDIGDIKNIKLLDRGGFDLIDYTDDKIDCLLSYAGYYDTSTEELARHWIKMEEMTSGNPNSHPDYAQYVRDDKFFRKLKPNNLQSPKGYFEEHGDVNPFLPMEDWPKYVPVTDHDWWDKHAYATSGRLKGHYPFPAKDKTEFNLATYVTWPFQHTAYDKIFKWYWPVEWLWRHGPNVAPIIPNPHPYSRDEYIVLFAATYYDFDYYTWQTRPLRLADYPNPIKKPRGLPGELIYGKSHWAHFRLSTTDRPLGDIAFELIPQQYRIKEAIVEITGSFKDYNLAETPTTFNKSQWLNYYIDATKKAISAATLQILPYNNKSFNFLTDIIIKGIFIDNVDLVVYNKKNGFKTIKLNIAHDLDDINTVHRFGFI